MLDNLFDRLSLFQDLTPEQRTVLRSLFAPSQEESGTIIFEQGDPAEHLYLVVEGEISVRFKPDDGPPLIVAHVRPEGVVGWSAALGSPTYTSAAVCTQPSLLLRIRGCDLRGLCEHYPETGSIVLERLAAVISERLRSTHDQVIALLEQGLRVSTQDGVY